MVEINDADRKISLEAVIGQGAVLSICDIVDRKVGEESCWVKDEERNGELWIFSEIGKNWERLRCLIVRRMIIDSFYKFVERASLQILFLFFFFRKE